jgi:hypothetical protein
MARRPIPENKEARVSHMREHEEAPVLNVLQIVAVHCALTLAIFVGFATTGQALAIAALLALACGPVLTLFTAAVIFLATSRLEERHRQNWKNEPARHGPPLVPGPVTDPMQLWEDDRLLEIDHAVSARIQDPAEKQPRKSREQMIRMWDIDGDMEAEAEGAIRKPAARRMSRR